MPVALVLTAVTLVGIPAALIGACCYAICLYVAEIVVGQPLAMDGSPGQMTAEVDRLCEELGGRVDLPVHRWDERLTTAEAERVLLAADVSRKKRRAVIDKLAAALILQSFLDRRLVGGGDAP